MYAWRDLKPEAIVSVVEIWVGRKRREAGGSAAGNASKPGDRGTRVGLSIDTASTGTGDAGPTRPPVT